MNTNANTAKDAFFGCLTILFLLICSLAKCAAQTNFAASRSILTDKETGEVFPADVGLFVEFSADTVTVRGQGIIFLETGVKWVQVDSGRCQAMGPGYVFQWWPGKLQILNKQVNWILTGK